MTAFRTTVLSLVFLLSGTAHAQNTTSPTVRVQTNLGDINVVLLPASAPRTVANFLNYVNRGAYNNSVIHRSVPGFIFQGGGYVWQDRNLVAIPADPPVRNEYAVSNTRGTLAMAKLGSDANSATNQWFFNLADNSANLNNQNGGFTVFGRVADDAGLAIMDKIAAVPVPNPSPLSSPFDQIPLMNYNSGSVQESNLVIVTSITQTGGATAPVIGTDGVVTAGAYGNYSSAAPGSYIEIYGSGFSGSTRPWAGNDFRSGRAPTALDGVSVTVNGQSAYVSFISPTQVNAQIPSNVPSGGSVPVIVLNQGQASAPVMLPIRISSAGIFAPPGFKVNGKQYAGAVHSANNAFVSNGSIEGVPAQPALPGETILLYGIGFGPVNPNSTPVAGQVVQGLTSLTSSVEFRFGETAAQVTYSGLVPGLVGLYQFNVVVPPNFPAGDAPLTVLLRGENIAQTLFISVGSR